MQRATARVDWAEPAREPRSPRPAPALRVVEAVPERRTIRIGSKPAPAPRRRSVSEARFEARPDRVAKWAFMLGGLLVFMAAVTAGPTP